MPMKFGTFHLFSVPPWTNQHDVIEQQLAQVNTAEQLGFHEAWLAEHNGQRWGLGGNCLIPAAAIAAATSRIRIGTAVTRLPLHHPLHLAEDLAYVDVLSRGRLDWGVGKGYDPLEFSTYGVPFDEREDRWQKTFDAVKHIWASGRTEYATEYFTMADAELIPRPMQRPELPIYVMVSKSDASVVWAAQHLYPIVLGQGVDWVDAKAKRELFEKTALAAGYSETAVAEALGRFWQLRQIHVSTTTERAEAEYRDSLMWYFQEKANRLMFGFPVEPRPYEWYVDHSSVSLGSPEKVAGDLADYAEQTGMPNVLAWFNVGHQPHGQVEASMRRFAEEVIPML
jgi:alkanesulfonate monooxygenase SsuD/methylene tetrahydromethanopterin reductase-like flavin-dependent oxidoreductase (luciferase family)